MKKLTQRQRQAINTKLTILEIATRLAKESSFEMITIQNICQEANISVGAFYHHFKSKKDIITIGYMQLDTLLVERFDPDAFKGIQSKILHLFGEGGDLLEELGVSVVTEAYRNQLLTRADYSFSHDRPIYIETKKIVDEAVLSGEIVIKDGLSQDYMTENIFRVVRGTIFDWCLNHGEYTLRCQIEKDLSLLFKGIF